jgi:hypothetical protein
VAESPYIYAYTELCEVALNLIGQFYMCVDFREYSGIYIIQRLYFFEKTNQKHSKHRQNMNRRGRHKFSLYTPCPLAKEDTCE